MSEPSRVQWPEHYEPRNCPVYVQNDLDMAAPPERVWAHLIRAVRWHVFYDNARNLRILEGPSPDLVKGTRFRWKTFGVTITSKVLEYLPGQRIAWDAHAFGVDAYHAWVLAPSDLGCHVYTEETQHGVLAWLQKQFRPHRMHEGHQMWLEGLEAAARRGLPPEV